MPDAISNTSPLQYLHQVGLLELLPRLYGRIRVPPAVVVEIDQGLQIGALLPDLTRLPWLAVHVPSSTAILRIAADLGPGEREVLALALDLAGCVVVLDDALARRYARLLGVRLTGTLGVLVKAKQVGAIGTVGPVIDHMASLGFHLDAATRVAILKLAGEGP